MFAFKKNQKLLDMLEQYLSVVDEIMDEFAEAFSYLLENGIDEHFNVLGSQTHKKESNADDLRRNIEFEMYQKSLLPESRSDILEVIELIDRIPSQAELLLSMFHTQQTELIDEIKTDMNELLLLSTETVKHVISITHSYIKFDGKINEIARLIDNNESVGDHLERKMIKAIFTKDIDTGEKILQKEFVTGMGTICDLCERVKDKLVITNIKRSI